MIWENQRFRSKIRGRAAEKNHNGNNVLVAQSKHILADNLVGVYLHGSAAMGCFHPKKSDIDVLVVVNAEIPPAIKRQYLDMIVALNSCGPEKGIELSVVRREVCKPFLYPTPFELHFSAMHLQWYQTDPSDYIEKMKGLDKDLAAHFTILYHRGRCLYGASIPEVFDKVDGAFYFDSIWNDIQNAQEDILTNPTYMILNLCRVLAYQVEGRILSKQEGGRWGMGRLPQKYHGLISQALDEYSSDKQVKWEDSIRREYAAYMIEQIKKPPGSYSGAS